MVWCPVSDPGWLATLRSAVLDQHLLLTSQGCGRRRIWNDWCRPVKRGSVALKEMVDDRPGIRFLGTSHDWLGVGKRIRCCLREFEDLFFDIAMQRDDLFSSKSLVWFSRQRYHFSNLEENWVAWVVIVVYEFWPERFCWPHVRPQAELEYTEAAETRTLKNDWIWTEMTKNHYKRL